MNIIKKTTILNNLNGNDLKWFKIVLHVNSIKETDKDLRENYKNLKLFMDGDIRNKYRNRIYRFMQQKILIYTIGKHRIGFILISDIANHLNFIHVEPIYRNKGYGEYILKDFIKDDEIVIIKEILEVNLKWFISKGFSIYKTYHNNFNVKFNDAVYIKDKTVNDILKKIDNKEILEDFLMIAILGKKQNSINYLKYF